MRLSAFLFILIPFATAKSPSDISISSMSTLSLPTSLPSIPPTSLPPSLSSPLSTSQTTSGLLLDPPPYSIHHIHPRICFLTLLCLPCVFVCHPHGFPLTDLRSSSTPSSSTASTSAATSSSFAPSVPVAVGQPQSSSSSTPISFINGAGAPTQGSPSSVVVLTSTMSSPSSTTTQSSSSGFFSNTGAVAGTFTVVGLVSIAGVIAVFLLIAKHRRSRSYEEDTEYLDKSPDLSADPSHHPSHTPR
ncbi:hypothetical protein J3R82DRAFT_4339 [Butyriboletus roseoflavus]|nr:hypothetical protein J3R82DRAFT_4339 [Butyriboletus roseoflavus]